VNVIKSVGFLTLLVCSLYLPNVVADVSKKSSTKTKHVEGADADRDFERATALIKAGKESEALVSLTDFLRRHTESKRVAEAQFLIGEVEFRRRNFEASIRELKKTLKYIGKDDVTVADAVFLMGQCWYQLGRKDRALIEWRALMRRFPGTPASMKAESKIQEFKGN